MRSSVWRVMACAAIVACVGCASSGTEGSPTASGDAVDERLPLADIRAAAELIERQVYAGNREPTLDPVGVLTLDTPEIRQAVRTRAARLELVHALLNSGHAWERANARLWIIRSSDYKKEATSRKRDLDAIMVNGENRDRWTIYEGLVKVNNLRQGGLNAFERAFFEARQAHMSPGQKYEGANGEPELIP